jgi:hypothetical protein
MDGESKQEKTRSLPADISDACNVLSTVWLRCSFCSDNGAKWIVLDGRRYLLLGFRSLLVLLYITYEILK